MSSCRVRKSERRTWSNLAVKLGVNLKVTDQIPNEELPETYRQADNIFVFTVIG